MIITKKDINMLRRKFWRISDELEREILAKFGEEPEPDENGHFHITNKKSYGEKSKETKKEKEVDRPRKKLNVITTGAINVSKRGEV